MSQVNFKPLGDRILVQAVEEQEVRKSGIIIPDSAKEKPQEGVIIALGAGKRADDGTIIAPEVKVGDKVLHSKYGGTEVTIEGEKYLILRESDVLAIIG